MHNDLICPTDGEREVLITWNIDQMAVAPDQAAARAHWKRADLLDEGGRSQGQLSRLEQARTQREHVTA